jgi:hypothetical protein
MQFVKIVHNEQSFTDDGKKSGLQTRQESAVVLHCKQFGLRLQSEHVPPHPK